MSKHRRGRAVDGILLLDKPIGLSSNQALQRVKRLYIAAKAGQHLLVENRGRAAGEALIDDQPNRIRADIDDRDRGTVIEPALGGFDKPELLVRRFVRLLFRGIFPGDFRKLFRRHFR